MDCVGRKAGKENIHCPLRVTSETSVTARGWRSCCRVTAFPPLVLRSLEGSPQAQLHRRGGPQEVPPEKGSCMPFSYDCLDSLIYFCSYFMLVRTLVSYTWGYYLTALAASLESLPGANSVVCPAGGLAWVSSHPGARPVVSFPFLLSLFFPQLPSVPFLPFSSP